MRQISKWSLVMLCCLAVMSGWSQVADTVPCDTGAIFTIVENMPRFPGGDKGLVKYLTDSLRYPAGNIDAAGAVYIRFVVECDGQVTHAEVRRGIHPAFDEEALKVIRNMPRWEPGTQNGIHVRVYFILPIRFEPAR